tara:strand:- start:3177 stop:3842 length:666 start_codon:yes stop_codon:yes gene_type:complete
MFPHDTETPLTAKTLPPQSDLPVSERLAQLMDVLYAFQDRIAAQVDLRTTVAADDFPRESHKFPDTVTKIGIGPDLARAEGLVVQKRTSLAEAALIDKDQVATAQKFLGKQRPSGAVKMRRYAIEKTASWSSGQKEDRWNLWVPGGKAGETDADYPAVRLAPILLNVKGADLILGSFTGDRLVGSRFAYKVPCPRVLGKATRLADRYLKEGHKEQIHSLAK